MKRLALFLIAAAAFAQVPSYRQLVYPPLKEVRPPEPVEVTLSNGMRVFLLENHELPVLRGFALVRDQDGHPVLVAAETHAGDTIGIEFADGRVSAKITEGTGAKPRPTASVRRRDGGSGNQGNLL